MEVRRRNGSDARPRQVGSQHGKERTRPPRMHLLFLVHLIIRLMRAENLLKILNKAKLLQKVHGPHAQHPTPPKSRKVQIKHRPVLMCII